MYDLFFYTYLGFSGLAALFSISMWLDYFRKIDVFEPEKVKHLVVAMAIGCITPFISIGLYRLIDLTGFQMTGEISDDLLYTIFAIGVNEELSKVIGVIIAFRLLKKYINEPIDYLVYAGVVALGFSIVENFKYFNTYGIQIITTRAFYSALVHIINTTLIVYGFYRLKLFNKGHQAGNTLVAFAVSAASHGLFDFFLMNNFLGDFTHLFSVIIYLIGINFWVQMLNNANNYSHHFNYENVHFSANVFYRLLFWYLATLIFTIIYNMLMFTPKHALSYFFTSLSSDGLLLLIVIIRASRFSIFKNKYFPVRIQLPFYITKHEDEDFKFLYLIPIKIRGESRLEYKLTTFLNKDIELHPLEEGTTGIKQPLRVVLTEKLLLKDDVVVYKVESDSETYYIKPRTRGETETEEELPISGLFSLKNPPSNGEISYSDLTFIDWVYVKK